MNLIRFDHQAAGRAAQPDSRTLTARQNAVMALAYLANAAIADELDISLCAVREALYAEDGALVKLGAENRTQGYAIWYERQRQGEGEMEQRRRAA